MADSLGNDIFLILVLSFSTCLVITRVLSSILFFFVIRISRLAIICIPCMHSCTLWSLLAEFFFSFLLHLYSWEQVKLSSSLVYPCIFQFISLHLPSPPHPPFLFFFHLFYCIPFRLSCRIGEVFYICLAFITHI